MELADLFQTITTNNNSVRLECRLIKEMPTYPYVLANLSPPTFGGYSPAKLYPISYEDLPAINNRVVSGVCTFINNSSEPSASVWGLAVVALTDPDTLIYLFQFTDANLSVLPVGTKTYTITLQAGFPS